MTYAECVNKVEYNKDFMKLMYEEKYNEWNGKYEDDRQLFCNCYKMIMEALDNMYHVTSEMVWVGFNRECKDTEKTMDRIMECFDQLEKMAANF